MYVFFFQVGDLTFLSITFHDAFEGNRIEMNIGMKLCFFFYKIGSQLIKWIMEKLEVDKKQASSIASQLLESKLIIHCGTNLLGFTEPCFYRFAVDLPKT